MELYHSFISAIHSDFLLSCTGVFIDLFICSYSMTISVIQTICCRMLAVVNWQESERKVSRPNFKTFILHFPGASEENIGNPQSGLSLTRQRFEASPPGYKSSTLSFRPVNVQGTSTAHTAL